ncbi:MAG TPA: hypothetical protein VMF89_14565 [Polyangiales bacterium]|nr:hypothetical protein [Polyangiales bacterium]
MKRMMYLGQVAALLLVGSICRAQAAEPELAPRSEREQVPQLDPKLAVGSATPGCGLDVQRVVDQLQLSLERNQRRGPTLVTEWYRGPLAASYLAPPVGFAVLAFTVDKETIIPPVLAGLIGVALPPIIHAAHNNSAGAWYSLLGIVGSVAVGALLGAAVGHLAPGDDSRKAAQEHNAIVFGSAGYSLWALLDTAFFARTQTLQP